MKEEIGGETGREARTRSTHFSSLPPLPPSLLLQGNLPFDIYDKVLEVYGEDAAKLVRLVIIVFIFSFLCVCLLILVCVILSSLLPTVNYQTLSLTPSLPSLPPSNTYR